MAPLMIQGPFATVTDASGAQIVGGRVQLGELDHMLIRDSIWELIRDAFTEPEKINLRRAVAGEAICPKGVLVAPDLLDGALMLKLMIAVEVAKESETIRGSE